MNAAPSRSQETPPAAGLARADASAMRWNALTEAGRVVGMLAASTEQDATAQADIEALLAAAPAWQRGLAATAIADLTAMMEPGIATLLEVDAAEANPRSAAEALWREFRTSRTAILKLLQPHR